MIEIKGTDYTGQVRIPEKLGALKSKIDSGKDEKVKATGRFCGYSWYFQINGSKWLIEIADDPSIEPEDLPLVGYGCSGWLYQSEIKQGLDKTVSFNGKSGSEKQNLNPKKNQDIHQVTIYIEEAFDLFKGKKLKYYPTVTCGCSDIS